MEFRDPSQDDSEARRSRPLPKRLIEDNMALVSHSGLIDGFKPKGSLGSYEDSIVKLLGEKDSPSRG